MSVACSTGAFRTAGNFIGSGAVDAGGKTVIGSRYILAFRCIHNSRRLEEFWKHRLNIKAANNDCLPLAA